jgi:hemoglobin
MDLLLIGAIVTSTVILYILWNRRKSKSKSLYDRLGGIYSIAAVVNHFSDNLVLNPIAGKNSPNPFLRDWYAHHIDRLPGLKFMRTLWLASLSGGPFVYEGTVKGKCPFTLENAHAKLQISPEEFDATAQVLANSLTYFKVPEKEKKEVLSAFLAHKNEINMGYDVKNNIKPAPVMC